MLKEPATGASSHGAVAWLDDAAAGGSAPVLRPAFRHHAGTASSSRPENWLLYRSA